MPYVPELNYS